MRIREPWPVARSRLRRRELATAFGQVPPRALGDMLEIGSGDGFLASLLEPLGRSLVASEPSRGRPAHGLSLPRIRGSATALPFPDASFDFIFSSSVLEHIRERAVAMAELGRCLRKDGVMLHIMPSPTWKLLQLAFYYVHMALVGLERIGAPPAPAEPSTEDWRHRGPKPSWWRTALTDALPQVHGEFDGHWKELLGFRARAWSASFREAGFAVRGLVKLPLCSGYGFGLERLRRAGERLGLSAHNAFILMRPEARPPATWFWPCPPRWPDAPG